MLSCARAGVDEQCGCSWWLRTCVYDAATHHPSTGFGVARDLLHTVGCGVCTTRWVCCIYVDVSVALSRRRDELAVKVAALEERLDEMRAEHGQAATYKQVLRRVKSLPLVCQSACSPWDLDWHLYCAPPSTVSIK